MARISVKKNKTDFQLSREELGYSREKASELLEFISPERLERIENEKMDVTPIEVLKMAEVYKNPSLCNYYCSKKCPIGEKFVPEIEIKNLEKIILRMVASLNSMQKCKDRLIEITADGEISDDEIKDFVNIQEELERISLTVDSLKLWSEQMLANGIIDKDKYIACKNKVK